MEHEALSWTLDTLAEQYPDEMADAVVQFERVISKRGQNRGA